MNSFKVYRPFDCATLIVRLFLGLIILLCVYVFITYFVMAKHSINAHDIKAKPELEANVPIENATPKLKIRLMFGVKRFQVLREKLNPSDGTIRAEVKLLHKQSSLKDSLIYANVLHVFRIVPIGFLGKLLSCVF